MGDLSMSKYADLLARLEERVVERRWTENLYHDPHATESFDKGPVNRDGAEAAEVIRVLERDLLVAMQANQDWRTSTESLYKQKEELERRLDTITKHVNYLKELNEAARCDEVD
jgi:hypothetical protein